MIHDFPGPKRARLTVRLAESAHDIEKAQELRWDTFYQELGAEVSDGMRQGVDADRFDHLCDHLLVEDDGKVVGTYRLLRQSVAEAHGGFYSAQEYRLNGIAQRSRGDGRELLELGRSCVAPAYRDAATIQMLWRGIAHYLTRHGISGMFGCASFAGIDPEVHALPLSYLAHHHLAPIELRASALPERRIEMAILPSGSYDARAAMRMLPPLIKGYLRVGAVVGDGAVIDHQFNTIDVFLFMPVEAITARYFERFLKAA